MTLDVRPQAKHARGGAPQMDVQSMTVVGVTTARTEDEDSAEYFDSHADVGEMQDPLLDVAGADETMKAKQKEVDRPAEFGVCEIGYHRCSRKEASHDTLVVGHRKAERDSSQELSNESMYGVFAPELNSEHRTHHRLFEPQEVVSNTHCRRDQRVLPRGRGR